MQEGISSKKPDCFGVASKVCPRSEEGFIEPNKECLNCVYLRECLKQVLIEDGVLIPPPSERPFVKKVFRFLKRWSKLKKTSTLPS